VALVGGVAKAAVQQDDGAIVQLVADAAAHRLIQRPATHNILLLIIIITCFSCLEARCVRRQAAVKAAKILPLVGLASSKRDPIDSGHGAQYLYAPPPAGANYSWNRRKQLTVFTLKRSDIHRPVGPVLFTHAVTSATGDACVHARPQERQCMQLRIFSGQDGGGLHEGDMGAHWNACWLVPLLMYEQAV
jgi:hypothetical protein